MVHLDLHHQSGHGDILLRRERADGLLSQRLGIARGQDELFSEDSVLERRSEGKHVDVRDVFALGRAKRTSSSPSCCASCVIVSDDP